MTAKCRILLLLSSVGILLAFWQRPCQAMVQKYRDAQEKILQQAQQQIEREPKATQDITKDILADAKKQVEQPAGPAASALAPVKQRIDQLLAKEEIKPEEIAALRGELERVASAQGTALNRAEYDSLVEKLDLAQRFVTVIDRLQNSQTSIVSKLNENFEAVAETGEKTEFNFGASVVANIMLVISLITRVGGITNAKLDKQLKQLQIMEKRAQLAKEGISLGKAS